MKEQSILKRRILWNSAIPGILFLVLLILENQMFGTYFVVWVYGIIIFVVGTVYYRRLKLWQFLLLFYGMAFLLLYYFIAARPVEHLEMLELLGINARPDMPFLIERNLNLSVWFVLLVLYLVSIITIYPLLINAYKLETSAMKLFKLAAREVKDIKDGFTNRPFAAGQHKLDENDLNGFGTFIENSSISIVSRNEDGMKFQFSMGVSPLKKNASGEFSYICLKNNEEVLVHISEQDYRQYRRRLTFHQLCEGMGKVFRRFTENYRAGQEKRILEELKSV